MFLDKILILFWSIKKVLKKVGILIPRHPMIHNLWAKAQLTPKS